jgi:hypothetical protein
MKLTIIESPYAGDIAKNIEYLVRCLKHSLTLDEAPFASHLFYTQFLDDSVPAERDLGMRCGFAWAKVAERVAVYTDLGVSAGMKAGITRATKAGIEVVYREIGVND